MVWVIWSCHSHIFGLKTWEHNSWFCPSKVNCLRPLQSGRSNMNLSCNIIPIIHNATMKCLSSFGLNDMVASLTYLDWKLGSITAKIYPAWTQKSQLYETLVVNYIQFQPWNMIPIIREFNIQMLKHSCGLSDIVMSLTYLDWK